MKTNRAIAAMILAASSLFFLLEGNLLAQEADWSKEAQEVVGKAAGLKSYRAKFVLEAKEENGETVRLDGELLFQAPNRRRLEIREGGSPETSQLLVSDGNVEWQYYPAAKTVYRAPAPPEIPGPHRAFGEIKKETLRFVEQVGGGAERLLRFEAQPLPNVVEGSPVPIQIMRVDVGSKDGLVRELALLDAEGQKVLSQSYQKVETNVSVQPDAFSFTAPEGVQVVDLAAQAPPAPEGATE